MDDAHFGDGVRTPYARGGGGGGADDAASMEDGCEMCRRCHNMCMWWGRWGCWGVLWCRGIYVGFCTSTSSTGTQGDGIPRMERPSRLSQQPLQTHVSGVFFSAADPRLAPSSSPNVLFGRVR